MLDKLFLQVLNMSFAAGVVILCVLAARLLLKKAPKIYSYALWSVVLFRLLCPFSFESAVSLLPTKAAPIAQEIVYMPLPEIDTGIVPIDNFVNPSLPPATPYASVNPIQIWVFLGRLIWCAGMVLLLAYSIAALLRLQKRLRDARHCGGNVYCSQHIPTAFVMGALHPKIYLPAGLSETEKEYILLHEQTHIRRFDHIVKLVSFLALCLHWFNPLVWLAFFLSAQDMEMSCDEAIVKRLGGDVKKEYSASLLTLATGRRIVGGTPLAFGEGDTKSRVKNVLNYRRPAFWAVVLLVVAVAGLVIGLVSNPVQRPQGGTEGGSATELWNARTQYVGDNSAVSRLIGLLPLPEGLAYDHFALYTSGVPYEIEIVYSASAETISQYEADQNKAALLQKNALLLLALVDNADGVRATLTDGSRRAVFLTNRQWGEELVGGDLRGYAQSPETLQELIGFPMAPTGDESYSIAKLGRNGQPVFSYSPMSGQLAKEVIFDYLIKSSIWQGVDIATLDESYRIRQRLAETNETQDYYAYLKDGAPVLQAGNNGMYASLSPTLYDALAALFGPTAAANALAITFPAYNQSNGHNEKVFGVAFTLQLQLPQGWRVRGKSAADTAYPLNGLWTPLGVYNAQSELVGAVGYNIYEPQQGAEDVPQAIYNQIALGNGYRFDAQPKERGGAYTPVVTGESGVTATTGVYTSAQIARGLGLGSEELVNRGVLCYHKGLQVYVGIELDSEKVTKEELELLAKTVQIVPRPAAARLTFWVKPDEPPEVIGRTAAEVWLKSYMGSSVPAESRLAAYEVTGVNVISGTPKAGERWEDMQYQYVVRVNYNITTAAEGYIAPGDGVSGKGTFEGLFRELCVKLHPDGGRYFEIVSIGTGGGEQIFADTPEKRVYFENLSIQDEQLYQRLTQERGLQEWQIHSLTNTGLTFQDMLTLPDEEIARILAPGAGFMGDRMTEEEFYRLVNSGIPENDVYVLQSLGYDYNGVVALTPQQMDFILPNTELVDNLVALGYDRNMVAAAGFLSAGGWETYKELLDEVFARYPGGRR